MENIIRESISYIEFMNEEKNTDDQKKIRTKEYVSSLKGESMSDEAKKRFVKDTVGTPDDWRKQMGYVKYAKEVISDNKESKPTKKMISPILGKGKSTSFKKDGSLSEAVLSAYKKINEAKDHGLEKQTLVSTMESIRVEYAKGIIRSMKLYEDLKAKAKNQYGMDDLSEKLEKHLIEDNLELEEALNILNKSDREEVLKYQKEINKMESDDEVVDLSDELTSEEKKELGEEKDIDQKNEISEDDTSFGASDLVRKYVNK